jgi:SPP1 gp7 family putative phage head morphogenesis protein
MGIREWFTRSNLNSFEEYGPQIVLNSLNPNNETHFKGEVKRNEKTFPVKLGEEHPFDFAITEGLYKKFGFSTAVVDKYVDYIVGPGFWASSEDERAEKIITEWMRDVNFDTNLRAWVKEALAKNGFLELGGKSDDTVKGIKVLDSKNMYVKRDKLGNVEEYNQYRGDIDQFSIKKVNNFKPHQIAHLAFNKIGDMAYGLGIMYPVINTINNLLQSEKDLHMLMKRKANAPYHVKLGGVIGGRYMKPNPQMVTKFGKDLEWLNNKHEWVTDGLTEIKAIDFGNIGDKFNVVLTYDVDMLLYGYQIPAVLMGLANINEGIAETQMDGFERRITSFQMEIEKVIEEKIFKRILLAQGIDSHVEFNWGRPSNKERYERLSKITPILTNMSTSYALKELLELETVKILDLDEIEFNKLKVKEADMINKQQELQNKELQKQDKKEDKKNLQKEQDKEERKREEDRPQPLIPGQNAEKPPIANENYDVNEEVQNKTISEWLQFNFKEYVNEINNFIKKDKFKQVAAATKLEEAAGLLSKKEVKILKEILETGFNNSHSILYMISEIEKKIDIKNLLKLENGKLIKKDGQNVIVKHKEHRASTIIRTEITRVANAGAVNHFKKNGIEKVRWVTSYGRRVCSICEPLNGQVYEINNHPSIPVHPNCRCTVIPVEGII